jgi:hypothetical protein
MCPGTMYPDPDNTLLSEEILKFYRFIKFGRKNWIEFSGGFYDVCLSACFLKILLFLQNNTIEKSAAMIFVSH